MVNFDGRRLLLLSPATRYEIMERMARRASKPKSRWAANVEPRSRARIRSQRKDAPRVTKVKRQAPNLKPNPKRERTETKKETKIDLRSGSVLDDGTAVISLSQTTVGSWRLLVSRNGRGQKEKKGAGGCSYRAQSQIAVDEGCQAQAQGA